MNFGTNTVLLTGASGWLGMNLVRALTRGLERPAELQHPQPDLVIRCLETPGTNTSALKALSERVEIVTGDIRNKADTQTLCQGMSGAVLFHIAGVIHPKRAADFIEINVKGTENLVQSAIGAGIRRVVVVSSNSPCGCNPHSDHLFDESSPYHPYMGYGRSKMLMEQSIKTLTDESAIESVIIRAPWFYGPYQPARQTLFFKMIREGKFPIVGSGENRRSMAYVDNLCQGLLLAALRGPGQAETYWIADKEPYSMNMIIETVERLISEEFHLPCKGKQFHLPGLASGVAGLLDASIQRLGGYHQKLHVLSEMNKTIACSVAKAERELGYAPTVALEEGMRRSIAWALEQGCVI